MNKILVAIDGSKGSMKAVEYVAQHFVGISDLKITLCHILPALPAMLWEEGHILTENEKAERKTNIDTWITNQKLKFNQIFETAVDTLVKGGLKQEQIETKSISDVADVAESILTEAKNGSYQTIVLGRRGLSGISKFFMGSVTTKIINYATGIAICVVE